MSAVLHVRLREALSLLLSFLAVVVLLPDVARGHGAGTPWIYVEAEQVWPGEPFHVLVIDLAPFVTVRLQAEMGDASATLGKVVTGPQGHGETDVTLPADFPFGHALLFGVADDGSEVSTLLRVGDVPSIGEPVGPHTPPSQVASPALTDPSVWTLGALVVGGVLVLAWLALRGRAPSPARATGAAKARSASAPARVRRKRR